MGGDYARWLSEDSFTQGDMGEELRQNATQAVSAYFFDRAKPAAIRVHLVLDEALASV